MKTLVTSLLISHIAAGTIALLIGLVPMFAQKGGRLHNRTGIIYVWCMTYVAASAALLCIVQPLTLTRMFLSGIAVFSFYLSTTGYRSVVLKRAKRTLENPPTFDRWLTYSTLVVSMGMIGFGAFLSSQSMSPLSILFTFFGALTFSNAFQDVRQFGKPAQKMHWFFGHINRMGGSYIAAFTAFLVNNNQRLLPEGTPEWVHLAGWIAPSVIGGMLIGRTIRHYKIKFAGRTQTGQVVTA